MKKLLGKKIGMISSFQKNGKLIPVTIISAEPNVVIEVKEKSKSGYDATKVGYLKVQEKSLNKSQIGVYKKNKIEPRKYMKEFRNVSGYNVGDEIKVTEFAIGDHVDVQAYTKGHGFTGAIKRWNFKCGPKSHGAGFPHRYQGSISFGRGGSQGQRVMKGKKMSGHYGVELVTIANLEVVDIDLEKNLILIKGAVPGPKNALVVISTTKKVKKFAPAVELVNYEKVTVAPKTEEPVVEAQVEQQSQVETPVEEVITETPVVEEVKVEESPVVEESPAVEEQKVEETQVVEETTSEQESSSEEVVEENNNESNE